MLYDIINIQCLEYPLLTLYHTKGTYAYYFFHHWTMIIIKSMCCYCCWTRLIYVLIFSNFYIFVGNLSSRNLFFVNQYFTFLLNFVSCFLKTPPSFPPSLPSQMLDTPTPVVSRKTESSVLKTLLMTTPPQNVKEPSLPKNSRSATNAFTSSAYAENVPPSSNTNSKRNVENSILTTFR